jgi:hypothetical protein
MHNRTIAVAALAGAAWMAGFIADAGAATSTGPYTPPTYSPSSTIPTYTPKVTTPQPPATYTPKLERPYSPPTYSPSSGPTFTIRR